MPTGSPLTADFLKTVSHGPGVYQMLGRREVLYVGKARDLRKRLATYCHFSGPVHSKTAVMLAKVRRVETILTTTEKEALILEASLIKKHRPRYNVILRDDKNYPLIKVTVQEEWPRIVVTRRRLRDGSRYFGPFSSGSGMRETVKLLHSMFPLRRCPVVKPRGRPCLNRQMDRCLAPCSGRVDRGDYLELVHSVLMVLEGRNRELIGDQENKMQQAARNLAFEKAAAYRDRIKGLKRTLERQVVVAEHFRDQDVFGLVRRDASIGIAILFVRSGMISGAQSFFLADPLGSDERVLSEAIIQYYSRQRQPPRELLLPIMPEDDLLLAERLSELREAGVKLLVPRRGRQMQLMAMAASNASQVFSEYGRKQQSWGNLAAALQHTLRLDRRPGRIECLDISNLGGSQAVGSLVCFKDGEKYTRGYRHYRIAEQAEPNDYAMMHEVLTRRLEKGASEDRLPDLLVLDGGKGQLNIALDIVTRLGLRGRIDLAAIAKEKEQEGEKLFRPGRKNPIILPRHAPVLLFLMRVRDEAHRFGITFHRKLRRRNTLASGLDAVNGIGPQRKKRLLKTFGSYKRILAASAGELSRAAGIGPALAASIYRQLHRQTDESGSKKSRPALKP